MSYKPILSDFTYHHTASDSPVQLTLQHRTDAFQSKSPMPVLISVHGGGLFCGSRLDLMYPELMAAYMEAGIAVVYPDYRLLDPSSCWDELEDIQRLFDYLFSGQFERESGVSLDRHRIAVAGFSAGSYIARLATVHVLKHRPDLELQACMLFYGMGGDCFLDYWLRPNRKPLPRPSFDRREISSAAYTPGIPTNEYCQDRSALGDHWWSTGDFLDLCTGELGFSDTLRQLQPSERAGSLDASKWEDIFPQLFLEKSSDAARWPRTLLLHGSVDPVVMTEESETTHRQLQKLGVSSRLHMVEGGDHNLDVGRVGQSHAPAKKAALQEAVDFIVKALAA